MISTSQKLGKSTAKLLVFCTFVCNAPSQTCLKNMKMRMLSCKVPEENARWRVIRAAHLDTYMCIHIYICTCMNIFLNIRCIFVTSPGTQWEESTVCSKEYAAQVYCCTLNGGSLRHMYDQIKLIIEDHVTSPEMTYQKRSGLRRPLQPEAKADPASHAARGAMLSSRNSWR